MSPYTSHLAGPVLLATLAWAPVLPGPAANVLASEFSVTVKTTTDPALQGQLVEFSLTGGLVVQGDHQATPQTFATADVVEIVVDNPALAPQADAVRLELLGGDLLLGQVTGFADQRADFLTRTLGTLAVPLSRIRLLRTAAADSAQNRRTLKELLAQPAGADDALLLVNGDVLRGLIVAIDDQTFTIETRQGVSGIPASRVAAAVVVPLDVPNGPTPRVRIHTTDGQRLTATQFHWTGFSALAAVLEQTQLKIAGDRIDRLDLIGGRWVWITALDPISYQHTPALSLPWSWHADRNVVGSPIRVAGRQFDRGLGVHGQSSITFDLKGAYAEFVTYLGLDDDTGPYANVDVEIRVDGQLQFQQQNITPGTLHGPVRLNVLGAQRIKLSVLLGANVDLQDRFDWVEAALIRR